MNRPTPRLLRHDFNGSAIQMPSKNAPQGRRVTINPLGVAKCNCPAIRPNCYHIRGAREWLNTDFGIGAKLEFVDAARLNCERTLADPGSDDVARMFAELWLPALIEESEALVALLEASAEAAEIEEFGRQFVSGGNYGFLADSLARESEVSK